MTNLDHMAEQAISRYRAYEEMRRQEAEAKKRASEEEAEEQLHRHIEELLSPEFRESVELSYAHKYQDHGAKQHSVSARFPYMKYDWHIERAGNGTWSIWTSQPGSISVYDMKVSSCEDRHLQTRLLVELGKYREYTKEQERKRQEAARSRESELTARRAYEEVATRKLNERIAVADAEDSRLRTIVTEAKAKAEREMWRWPEGVIVEVYHVQWCKGSHRDEDSEGQFDYDGGWTGTSHLDEHGRIRLEKVRSYGSSDPRTVQLIPDVHKPVWTVHRYSAVEELPEVLQMPVEVKVEGVATRRDNDLDGKTRLFETREVGYDEHWYSEEIGKAPLHWIRDLVDKEVVGE